MQTEIEAKFADIDQVSVRARLREIGATMAYPERLMRRKVFDYPDRRLYGVGGWVRVRDEGDEITLCYKQLNDRTPHGTKEVSVVVDDFEKTCDFLIAIGLQTKAYQETKREKWVCGDVEITIDTWPWIPTFAEIEGPSEEAVVRVADKLGFDWRHAMHGSVETVYQMHYDVSDEEIDHWESITFVPTPKWLLERKSVSRA